MFAKKKPARTCEKGHALESSWERCPYCEAEKRTAPAAEEVDVTPPSREDARDLPVDVRESLRRPVVVPRRAPTAGLPGGWLVALCGEQAGKDFRLDRGRNVLGKGGDCTVAVKDAQASERHILIEIREDGEAVLTDLGSRHGTLVNGQPVTESCPLRDGDRVRLGGTELAFRAFRPD